MELLPDPVEHYGRDVCIRNTGLVLLRVVSPGYNVDELPDGVTIPPGGSRLFRAQDFAWWTTAEHQDPITCSVISTVSVSVVDITEQSIEFNTETFDYGNLFDPAIKSRITAPVTGRYLIGACLEFAAIGPGLTLRFIALRVNGATIVAKTNWDTTGAEAHTVHAILELNAGDYVELIAWQNSGAPLDATAQSYAPAMWASILR